MTLRSSRGAVTFVRPFKLPNMDEAYPAGTYEIEMDQEVLDHVSLLAYRRVSTRIVLARRGRTEIVDVSQRDLDAALITDRSPLGTASNPS